MLHSILIPDEIEIYISAKVELSLYFESDFEGKLGE